jgi:hypothetical protein
MVQAGFSGGQSPMLLVEEQAVAPEQALATADRRLAAIAGMLERQVVVGPVRLLDDETVARVRGLIGDLAGQLAGSDTALIGPVRTMLAGNRAILTHCHALAVEWRLAMSLAARNGLDPVLPPLVRRRLSADADVMAATTAMIAAQARSSESLRRMRLSLGDCPADLRNIAHAALDAARAEHTGEAPPAEPQANPADARGRLVLLHRVVAGLGEDMALALRIEQAGAALFFTALAIASGQPREVAVLASAEDDPIRLALLLRAAGLARDEAGAQFLLIRPEADATLVDAADSAAAAEALLGASR